eukprot:XP_011681184.1 PREDICTED: TATA box-binding protein-associated factor RNA polymerase I subunit A [Strongylocentrotus purpuratus]
MESSVPSTSKAKPTNSKSNREKGNAKKKKQKDEGSQSSLRDFVIPTKSDKKKRKEKEKKMSVTKSGMKEKHVKKKKKKDKDKKLLKNGTENFTKIKEIDSKKKGKEKAGKSSIINSDIDCTYIKKKKGKSEESQSNNVTNYVLEQHNASNKEEGMDKAGTSTVSRNENAQNGPQKDKRKGKESKSTATNSESELNDQKKTRGKDSKESGSSATDSREHQIIPKKRKGNSEAKPGSSKKRKKDGSPQQSHEERGSSEDAFLLQHPHLANHIKGQLNCEGVDATSFMAMSNMVKECVLQEKWEDANRVLCTMCLYQTPNVECLWKFGAHVLQNHPSGNAELVEDLYRFVRKINMTNPYQKKLEHALFLLRENRMKDAFTTLTEMWGVSGRWVEQQSNQPEIRKKMNSAYTGLMGYCQWLEKRKNGGDDDRGEIVIKEATLRKRALNNLGKFNDDPGVWDIFITKQVEMLEAKENNVGKAEELLNNYLSQNPGNPNAHVYLYQFLKRHNKTKKLKPVLKKLATILPAEDYTLEYVNLLLEQKKGSADSAEVLPMLFKMADYSTCRYNTALWETLLEHVIAVVESRSKQAKALLKECWSRRKSWWTRYHFDKHGASESVKKNPDVAQRKAILASIFFGSSYSFVQKVQEAIQKIKPELSEELENEISLWCHPAL